MRLIDADKLIEHAWRDKLDSRELIAEMIMKAPTVKEIPVKLSRDMFEQLVLQKLRWTPVSKRLPDDGRYLCDYGDCIDFGKIHNGKWFVDGVIAWMPLPEPYKAESEK